MARPPKFDYDSDDFYDEILALSMQGLTDAEIADNLEDKFKTSLSPEVFCCMKNGTYEAWSEEENERRSARLSKVLARGRRKINSIVRGAYLKAALGGKKLKNKSTTTRRMRLPDGTLTDSEDIQTTVSEIEQAPNMQALSTWLYHHEEEWRKVEKKQEDDEDDVPHNTTKGVDIDAWIRKEVGTDN